jgi:hypothetical protein
VILFLQNITFVEDEGVWSDDLSSHLTFFSNTVFKIKFGKIEVENKYSDNQKCVRYLAIHDLRKSGSCETLTLPLMDVLTGVLKYQVLCHVQHASLQFH